MRERGVPETAFAADVVAAHHIMAAQVLQQLESALRKVRREKSRIESRAERLADRSYPLFQFAKRA